MARTPSLTLESLTALGPAKLAQLILDEAQAAPAFRKLVNAALAAVQGSGAVAKLIDRRLAALERARAVIAWEKERAFAEDLGATVQTILTELAPLVPAEALQRLLRFIDTHGSVFNRIDDSGGRIQSVYWNAADAVPDLVNKLAEHERAYLPQRLQASLARDTHGLAVGISVAVVPLLPADALQQWDLTLQQGRTPANGALSIRQAIAVSQGNLDQLIALERSRPDWQRDPLKIARLLLDAGRLGEALDWVRRERKGGLAIATAADLAEGRIQRADDIVRVRLEARILDAMGERAAAQVLRWQAFEARLDADILREYLTRLDDFTDHDQRERAFEFAATSPQSYLALTFFLAWPNVDRAAALVLAQHAHWDGRHYDVLYEAAEALAPSHPLAASMLYRALLDDILTRAKSKAYGHGARHLARLADLARGIADFAPLAPNADYVARLRKLHSRKTAFWELVGKKGHADARHR